MECSMPPHCHHPESLGMKGPGCPSPSLWAGRGKVPWPGPRTEGDRASESSALLASLERSSSPGHPALGFGLPELDLRWEAPGSWSQPE